jgi:hypothetical protein
MPDIINNLALVVNLAIGFVGITLISMIVIGGYKIGTAQGDARKFEQGKTTLIQAGVGTLIIMFAFTGGNFYVSQVSGAPGAPRVQQVAAQDIYAIEAPMVSSAYQPVVPSASTYTTGITVLFNEEVNVINGHGIGIATSDRGILKLVSNPTGNNNKCQGSTFVPVNTYFTDKTSLLFCLDNSGTTTLTGTIANRFIFARGSKIEDKDGNPAIVAFPPVQFK